jgi:uncharacterized damage-inducible protein DinB
VDSQKDTAFGDLERELKVTRTVLDRLPPEHYEWKAHEKSMSLGQLALHVATMPHWIYVSLAHEELDVENAPRTPKELKQKSELLTFFDKYASMALDAAKSFDMAKWDHAWSLKHGDEVIVTRPRPIVYRIFSLNHLIHHRGQLCVYLRMLNVPVPTVYFNTADEPGMAFE